MLRIAAPLKSFVQRGTYLALVLAAFGLMLIGKTDAIMVDRLRAEVTDAVAPILEALSRPITTVSKGVDNFRELSVLRDENLRLRQENTHLLQWQTAARKLGTENLSLRAMLGFVPDPDAKFITARVIADTGGAFAHTFILNAGSRAGVTKGQAVISHGGLVGRVAEVGKRSSRVLLVTDLNSRIPVLVEPGRARAIMAGNNSDRPRLIHLAPGARISLSNRVVTSGHGGAFPPGLPVGIVASVSDGGVSVQPILDRFRLEFVRAVDFSLATTVESTNNQPNKGKQKK
ncbi:MAG: rod shape-determining protein MreC [Rhodospirillales bacterium]|nr:rod shape-determining protein MreC [Rhodospirillales bacterium]